MKIEEAIEHFEREIRENENIIRTVGAFNSKGLSNTNEICKMAIEALKEKLAAEKNEPLTIKIEDVDMDEMREILRRNPMAIHLYDPRPKGKWENEVEKRSELYGYVPLNSVVCSVCGKSNDKPKPFCPNCGAEMETQNEK